MCFQANYEWYAEVVKHSEIVVKRFAICDECGDTIQAGEKVHHTFCQQHEECRTCTRGYCRCNNCEDNGCQCEEPNYGETCEYYQCLDCRRFLEAVKAAELEAGCRELEATPPPTCMEERISDGGAHEAKRYWKKAKEMHPELITSGYLPRLWRRMFAGRR